MAVNKPKDNDKKTGAVLVVGGGISGIQAALDLAETGFYVYLVEKKSAIGGVMPQLDKTFPTNDCSMCTLAPKLVEVGRHLNIEILAPAEVTGIEGTGRQLSGRGAPKEPGTSTRAAASPAAFAPRNAPRRCPTTLTRG